jgi:predicted nucleotide-binding protein
MTASLIKARFIDPMLRLRADRLPDGGKLQYEVKLDGFRAIAFKSGGKVHLRSRNDSDFNSRYRLIAKALSAMPDETVIERRDRFVGRIRAAEFQCPAKFRVQPESDAGRMTHVVRIVLSSRTMKSKLFIGSSSEGIKYANALQRNLARKVHARIWTQGIFRAGNYTLEDLLDALSQHDFAAFIFLPEDIAVIRGVQEPAVRDNLIFELGLFIGRIGRKRAFFIKPQGAELHLPSDLKGINASEFDVEDENLIAGMGPAASEIAELIAEATAKSEATRAPEEVRSPAYAREKLRQDLMSTNSLKPLLRGRKYTRNDAITVKGDIRILETWEGVTSYTQKPVSEINIGFQSRSGRQADCRCESLTPNQSVFWKWNPTNDDVAESKFIFDPPIGNNPISFRTERYVFNGVSFSQADRLEMTNGKEAEEAFRVTYRHLWESCSFHIKFPEHRFPNLFRVSVYGLNGEEFVEEQKFAENALDRFPETQDLFLKLEYPLPGIRYQIHWQLPEGNTSLFSQAEQGFVDEVTRRILGLRILNVGSKEVTHALADARALLTMVMRANSDEPIQVALYIYDRQKAGLVCAATLDADNVETNWDKYFFKPGRGVVGSAFRKRGCALYSRDQWKPELDLYEPVIEEDESTRPQVIICVPLFYPHHPERALAILSFESKLKKSSLLPFFAEPAVESRIEAEFQNWYTSALAHAVGLPSTHRFWHGEAVVNVGQ